MARVETEDYGSIVITAEWREREAVKLLPGAKWDAGARTWRMPLSWAACVQSRGVFGDELEIGPNLNAWAAEQVRGRIAPCMELRDSPDATHVVYAADRLEPRQRAGVAFMATAGRCLNADGMGSGKTVQTICAVEELAARGGDPFPVLVVCPNSMVYTWVREIEAWAPGRTVEAVKGSAKKRREALERRPDYAVINWEGLKAHTRLAGYGYVRLSDKDKEEKELNEYAPATVVADEAHRAKNPKAQQTRAWWWLAHRARYSFALTGTPVANSPEDLWSIMHGVEQSEWPSKTRFIDRYGLTSYNPFGGMSVVGVRAETRDELFRVLDPRMIRRPTQVVVPNIAAKLPPQVREFELPTKQRRAYEAMRREMIAELDSGVLMATSPLSRLTRLSQLAAAYGEVNPETGEVRLAEPSGTLDAFDDVLEEYEGEPLIAFAVSRQLVELASARLTKRRVEHALVTGAVQPAARQQAVDAFQAGHLRLLLLTLGAGGTGLTLTAARVPVFLQRSWSLVENLQAVDRCWRRGQDRDVQPIHLEPRDTIAQRVRQAGYDKEGRLEEIVRDADSLRRLLT